MTRLPPTTCFSLPPFPTSRISRTSPLGGTATRPLSSWLTWAGGPRAVSCVASAVSRYREPFVLRTTKVFVANNSVLSSVIYKSHPVSVVRRRGDHVQAIPNLGMLCFVCRTNMPRIKYRRAFRKQRQREWSRQEEKPLPFHEEST